MPSSCRKIYESLKACQKTGADCSLQHKDYEQCVKQENEAQNKVYEQDVKQENAVQNVTNDTSWLWMSSAGAAGISLVPGIVYTWDGQLGIGDGNLAFTGR